MFCILSLIVLFQSDPLRPSRTLPSDFSGEQPIRIKQLLKDFGCKFGNDYYLCDRLPAFSDNSWEHPLLYEFSEKVKRLYKLLESRLPSQMISIAVEGIADARKIQKGKHKLWSSVPEGLNPGKRDGKIYNLGIASLRARNTVLEIKNRGLTSVQFLEPVDHLKTSDRSVGDEYKAAVIYIRIIPNPNHKE